MELDLRALTWAIRDDIPAPFTIRNGAHYEPTPESRPLRIIEADRSQTDAITLTLEPVDRAAFRFRGGQFVTVLVPLGEETVRRAYSICSDPAAPHRISLAIRRVPGGRVSEHLIDNVQVGDTLRVQGPSGQFGLNESRAIAENILLVGAGSGITPLLSIAYAALKNSATSRVTCLVGNRNPSRMMLGSQLRELADAYPERFTLIHTFSQPEHGWQGLEGHIAASHLEQALESLRPNETKAVEAFICGPTAMMSSASATLVQLGCREDQIHTETFTPPAKPALDAAPVTEPLALSIIAGTQNFEAVIEPGETILEAALRAGAPMPYSCSVGGCGACKVNLQAGEVSLPQPNCLSKAELHAGATLTCVGCARSPITIELPK